MTVLRLFIALKRRFALVLSGVAVSASLLGQGALPPEPTTRSEAISLRQAEKAKTARPPEPDRLERLIGRVEKIFLVDPSGWFPYFDSVYQGGGITLGAGYRGFFGDNTFWQVKGLYSFLNYKLIEGAVASKDRWNRRLSLNSRLGWRDATQVAYYGIGMQSKPEDRTNYRFQQTYADGEVIFRPRPRFPIKGSLAYEHWSMMQGEGSDPSIETRYTSRTAPGLGADPSYLHTIVSAGIDWRQSPGYSRRGGLYEVTFHDYHNTGGGPYSFQKLDGQIIQHIPLMRETWVLAGRARVETTLNDNNLIPYFLLPSLGSGSTLRAFSSYRFRDRHSMLMNAEFRWIPSVGLDMAIFYDAGKVTARRGDLDFKGLKSNVGIGARFHGPFMTPIRVDLAVGNEGWRLVISGGPIF